MTNWKTTVAGVLSSLIGIFTSLLAYQIPTALINPNVTHAWLWVTVGLNIGTIIARSILGSFQNDAPPPK